MDHSNTKSSIATKPTMMTTTTTTPQKNKNKIDDDSNSPPPPAAPSLISYWHILPLLFLTIIVGSILSKAMKDPIVYMIPNFLLLTPFRDATSIAWDLVLKYDTSYIREPIPIPELTAEEYTYDTLRIATNNWKSPVVVRGLFTNTTAVQKWIQPGYVASKIGHYDVAVVQSAHPEKMDTERITRFENFHTAFHDVLTNENSTKYLFFPLKSRIKKGNETAVFEQNQLIHEVNEMTRIDLHLDRLWKGFGLHKTYSGAQFIAGRGRKTVKEEGIKNSGSNWHCAIGNNWFVQIAGEKHWEFLDQEYSAYMKPQRDGLANIITGSRNIIELQKYLPIKYVHLKPGDLLYNPDFEWHKIINYPGISIATPLREANTSLARRNNEQYFALVAINMMFAKIGISYGLIQRDFT